MRDEVLDQILAAQARHYVIDAKKFNAAFSYLGTVAGSDAGWQISANTADFESLYATVLTAPKRLMYRKRHGHSVPPEIVEATYIECMNAKLSSLGVGLELTPRFLVAKTAPL